jgi:hypothetical protein
MREMRCENVDSPESISDIGLQTSCKFVDHFSNCKVLNIDWAPCCLLHVCIEGRNISQLHKDHFQVEYFM